MTSWFLLYEYSLENKVESIFFRRTQVQKICCIAKFSPSQVKTPVTFDWALPSFLVQQQGCHLGTGHWASSPPQEQPQQFLLPSASHSTWVRVSLRTSNEIVPHHCGQRNFYCWGIPSFSSSGIPPFLFPSSHSFPPSAPLSWLHLLTVLRDRSAAAAETWISALPLAVFTSLTVPILGFCFAGSSTEEELDCKGGGLLSVQGEFGAGD